MAESALDQLVPPTHMGVGRYALPANAVNLVVSGDYSLVDPPRVKIPSLGATGLMVFVNMTIASGAGNTVTVFLDTFDPVSGTFIPLGAGIALTSAVGAFVAIFDPRIATAAGKSMQTPLPDQLSLRFVGSGTRTTLTYSAGAALCI